jgi:hypothetical protein
MEKVNYESIIIITRPPGLEGVKTHPQDFGRGGEILFPGVSAGGRGGQKASRWLKKRGKDVGKAFKGEGKKSCGAPYQ